ncbi:hypothetical protein IEQ34_021887 [Dendrobium chrysotoxum]|uniref:Uncharacterized protein n=1 Tax=Dendrobium chrysotoxum TaxID=161865 RepID=A0AAV7FXG5_DENCH|nr:hypothetical protein IEQ34_021887 [Dendrobium chrysotoxum]
MLRAWKQEKNANRQSKLGGVTCANSRRTGGDAAEAANQVEERGGLPTFGAARAWDEAVALHLPLHIGFRGSFTAHGRRRQQRAGVKEMCSFISANSNSSPMRRDCKTIYFSPESSCSKR